MEITEIDFVGQGNQFPLYAQSNKNKSIWKFLSHNEGVVTIETDSSRRVGVTSNNLHDCTNEDYWRILPKGTVLTVTI